MSNVTTNYTNTNDTTGIANTVIRIKRSGTAGDVPSDLQLGELALNYTDGILFYKNNSNTVVSFRSGSVTNATDSFATLNVNSSLILATTPTDILNLGSAGGINLATNPITKTITIDDSSTVNLAQSSFNKANSNYNLIQSVYTQSNTALTSIQSSFNQANSAYTLAQAGYNQSNNMIAFVQAAFDKANTAQTVYVSGNTSGNISNSFGNTIPLGTATQGSLTSNAVSLAPTSTVTNSIAQLNQVLGKLVPPAPPQFPGSYGNLTINNLIGPYRMTNFVQQDNSSNNRSVPGGTSVSVLRTNTFTTSSVNNVGPGDSGTLTVYKNNVATGTRTLTSGNNNNGTYGDLIINNNVDYSTITGAAAGFWSSLSTYATGLTSNGWNEVYISDSTAGRTSAATWYYDNSNPGTPSFSSLSMVPQTPSLTYSSSIPHYNSSTTFLMGFNVNRLSGDMFPTSNTFVTGAAGGAFGTPSSNTYSAAGISYPLARNLYVSSGSVKVNTTAQVISGFGSSSTGPTVTVDNSYNQGSQSFTAALANTILYKTGTSSSMEETSLTIGSSIGTGSGLAFRIVNPGSTDTPAYTGSEAAFNSQTGTLQTYDATIVGGILSNDQTNYSVGYLPKGPNLSVGRSGPQYFTFKFVRASVSKFDIQFTGTIAGLWVALPGSSIDNTSTLNGWLDMSTPYAGSGKPGAGVGGNGLNGCALGGPVTLNSSVTNHRKTCTFGTVSSSDTGTNEIYVRIKLTSGQSVSALSLQTASN
jgi:hypothetical protein